ncbi:MAG: PEP-CTERM sorting domain-containing protein [Sedimentisphaerales bacterium]
MKKHRSILILLTLLFVGFLFIDAKASSTIATFADPSISSSNPLFTVDFTALTLNGRWSDDQTGLTLQVPYNGHPFFSNAWFETSGAISLTQIVPSLPYYNAGAGVINFYKDGTSTNPLIVISFDSGFVSPYGFGANEVLFTAANVSITGSEITDTLSQEQFSFSFANVTPSSSIGTTANDTGFTATASFTSSATVPEPTTICLLGFGALSLIRRKK